jgi:hypothetical protein
VYGATRYGSRRPSRPRQAVSLGDSTAKHTIYAYDIYYKIQDFTLHTYTYTQLSILLQKKMFFEFERIFFGEARHMHDIHSMKHEI